MPPVRIAISSSIALRRSPKPGVLRRAKKVTVEKENTTIVSGAGKKSDIQGRIARFTASSGREFGARSGGLFLGLGLAQHPQDVALFHDQVR
jgi:hypothetical protein